MARYYIHFKAFRNNGQTSVHTCCIECDCPIEYDSDIAAVQEWAAKDVKADAVMLLNWHELKGAQRPKPN
ncbi:hypothetical protein [Pseudomonas aeruginosa]|uniref:hypothetical protein n=1 Tax=Pseudomonas aeruginosa TaxID=287 RepID=UPI001ADC5695|nr:hypothetical protein [Pseudomonas aeruginosa]MBO8337169.1 hypothetical protein [Pseudomonas aeruginosa]HCF4080803.1 hypothetical protein [Pseudomonas aeruginosa]